MPQTIITAGKNNDPSVAIGGSSFADNESRNVLLFLGFTEKDGGQFVYNADGRAIWVDAARGPRPSLMQQIVQCAEGIGARTKINEIRKALDLPFEPVAVVTASDEQAQNI